jgi:hypothetical protein
MALPRFTAQNSLYRSQHSYAAEPTFLVGTHMIVTPQMICQSTGYGYFCYDDFPYTHDPGRFRDLGEIACRRGCYRLPVSRRAACLAEC